MPRGSKPTAKKRAAKKNAAPRVGPTPTQIAVTSNSYGVSGQVVEAVTVLCDDGSIWRFPMVGAQPDHMVWTQIPAIGSTTTETAKE